VNAPAIAKGAQGRFEIIDGAVRAALQRLKDAGENLREPLQSLGHTWKERVALGFHEGRDPWGNAWEPLAERTKRKRRQGGGEGAPRILRDIGLLMNSRAYRTTARALELFLGNTNRPVLIHQFGGRAGRGRKVNIPARPMLPILPSGAVDLPPAWRDEMVDVLAAHLDPAT
jgi:phage virion morphogenesis protein